MVACLVQVLARDAEKLPSFCFLLFSCLVDYLLQGNGGMDEGILVKILCMTLILIT